MVGMLGQMQRADVMPHADELLDRFGLSHAANRPLRTSSGGMRWRLDVAASLMPRPPVLFLDEPTTGLDLPSREELWDMIRELVEGGKVIANDSPERLKAQMGGIVIEMGMPGDGRADRQWACSPTASPVGSSAKGGRLGGGHPRDLHRAAPRAECCRGAIDGDDVACPEGRSGRRQAGCARRCPAPSTRPCSVTPTSTPTARQA